MNLNQTTIKIELGKQFKKYRLQRGLNQLQMAELLGYKSGNSIARWESGNMELAKFESALKKIGITKFNVHIDFAPDFTLE